MLTLREIEAQSRRDREHERRAIGDLLAGLYGLRLRQLGYAVDEAAELVIERYPHTAYRLDGLVRKRSDAPERAVV